MDGENAKPDFLGVRETAKRLDVHENTIRNWVKAGVLPSARVPGSRFHRFDSRDIERLRATRGSTVASVASGRRTIGPELVDATQLSQWATTRDAQDRLPAVVRRLLASTPGITNVSMRAGDGVSAPGRDGRADSSGTSFLPKGRLLFELGVGGKPKAKADEDYEKRRDELQGAAADLIFVFVTPRRWGGGPAWMRARSSEKLFADVVVLDADDLEGWLVQTPEVHHWLSEQLGRRPRDAETLERWWSRFRDQTSPALPPDLFLAGRASEQAALAEFVSSPPGVVAIKASWRREAIAFTCAVFDALKNEHSTPVQPPLLVSSSEVWDRVVLQPGRMTLLPLFDEPNLATAQSHGHHVIIPLGREDEARGSNISLPALDRTTAVDALRATGVESDRAYSLAALARRSMPSFVRALARDPRIARPPWAQGPSADLLGPLVLVGAWTACDDDKTIVARMADADIGTIEKELLRWRKTDDPPFVRPGTQWHLASPEEAFMVLRESLTGDDLDRWRDVAVTVLTECDPRLELPVEERPMAGVLGVVRQYSAVLRRGLAEGVALVSTMGTDLLADGVSGEDHARRLVRELLGRANADGSGALWHSLSDQLPLLAEAAPDDFLDAVHEDLDTNSLLATMFQDSDESSWLYSSSPHTGLLWALENLCWSSDYLLEATRALARLDAVDPGGRLANRPLQSLSSVLVPWIRHTAAPLDVRIKAIENIARRMPDLGWRLLKTLWPSFHATSSPPHSPRYHDWAPAHRGMPNIEWFEMVANLVRLGLLLAGDDVERWCELSSRLGSLPPSERTKIIEGLEALSRTPLEPEYQLALWEQLHTEVARHRKFAGAEWALGEEWLARLESIASKLEPISNAERHAYLFEWHPDLADVDFNDHAAHDARLRELRIEAVRETLASGSSDALERLAARSRVPRQLGWVVAEAAGSDLAPTFMNWLDADESYLRDLAFSWSARKLQDEGIDWFQKTLKHDALQATERRIALALSAPANSQFWDALADSDSALYDAYWERVASIPVSAGDVERAARELLAHGRAWAAVDVLSMAAHRKGEARSGLSQTLVEETLTAALTASPAEARNQMLGYEVGQLLDYLEEVGSSPDLLARFEFIFFRLLEDHRQPRALYAALGDNPSLFVDLVSRVYRGRTEPKREVDEHEEALAHHAWWVLNHWSELPGRRGDGTIDGEHLTAWVRAARLALSDSDRGDIGDEQIGQVLAQSPVGTDQIWPAEPVREIVETIGSQSLETGIHVGVYNSQGVTTRGAFDGGDLEWAQAHRYREWARKTSGDWPRTSRLLRGLADSFGRDAQRADASAQVRGDTE